jgi:hypothetical protein
MKKIVVVLALLFFAAPAFAQFLQSYEGYLPYQLYQLDQSQPDQSFRFYQPYSFEQPQPKQTRQPQPAQIIHNRSNTKSHSLPVNTK